MGENWQQVNAQTRISKALLLISIKVTSVSNFISLIEFTFAQSATSEFHQS
jgi:hypothetical protein